MLGRMDAELRIPSDTGPALSKTRREFVSVGQMGGVDSHQLVDELSEI